MSEKPKKYYGYRLFKRYVRLLHNRLAYRHVHVIGLENVPPVGMPTVFAGCHQNCANDPLVLLLSLDNSCHPYVLARANVFDLHPLITGFLHWLGLMPAYRLAFEGADSVSKNSETIRQVSRVLLGGGRLVIFPEGGHQQGHYLGDFSLAYLRMAFESAEQSDFQKEIFIQPWVHHYEDYFAVQADVVVRFGNPISLKPYYELYKTRPRTAQRQVNLLVRDQIEAMMLDVKDVAHYEAIDAIRSSTFGDRYAVLHSCEPKELPAKLNSDKMLVKQLETAHECEPERVEELYRKMLTLCREERMLGVSDHTMERPYSVMCTLLSIALLLGLLPLWLVSLYPALIMYLVPYPFLRSDKMFTNTYRLIFSVVVLYPLFAVLTFLVMGLAWGFWWQAAVWIACWFPLGWIAGEYSRFAKRTLENLRMLVHPRQTEKLRQKRDDLYIQLDNLLKK